MIGACKTVGKRLEERYCRNACLWYGVFMGKMVRFLIVLSLSGMAAAQDIAPPAVPGLNRDTEEGRVRERNRKEIRSFLAQLCLVRNLPSFEVIIRGGNGLATEFYQVILEEFPENALKRCPADFQELVVVKKSKIQEFLDGLEKNIVWPYVADEEVAALLFKYGLKDEEERIARWVTSRLGFRKSDTPAFKARRIRELKEEMEAGKVVVPENIGEAEEMVDGEVMEDV